MVRAGESGRDVGHDDVVEAGRIVKRGGMGSRVIDVNRWVLVAEMGLCVSV